MRLLYMPRILYAVMLAMFFVFHPFSNKIASADSLSLTTLFAYNNQYAGNMFDLTVLSSNDIVIHSFDVNITSAANEEATVDVYYRLGGYSGYEDVPSAWTLAGTTSVTSNGLDTPTPISVGDFTLTAGETYGIYITVTNYNMPYIRMYYTNGTTAYENDDIKLSDSIGRGTPLFTGIQIADRIWNGTIYYTVAEPTPTLAPTPTASPTVTPTATAVINPQTGDRLGGSVHLWLFIASISVVMIVLLYRKTSVQ